ncbi:germ cell nuclear acidic protein [Dasypus novemcinctus]|uniref:germ cell nuclear acidic protein n=1 Tax=Dasypus novemcinctus TaxID=9361 RepID=UPI0026602C6B|nr:germ cell nuclear acidic protein [Dasypus novemcinctus]XP_058146894.1 germ cell nuclear acidic protein [Dasypus novemcinctus]
MPKGAEASGSQIQDDDCYIFAVDSSGNEEFQAIEARMRMEKKRQQVSCVVIDDSDYSDCDDEYFFEEKRSKLSDIRSGDEILKMSKQSTIQEPPILITDDSSDLEGPMLIEESSCENGQIYSDEKELHEFSVSKCDSSKEVGEQNLCENLCQLPNEPEATVEILDENLPTNEEPEPVVEQPKKRKAKTKNISVTPAVIGPKRRAPSKKKFSSAKFENCESGNSVCKVPGCFLLGLENAKQYSGKNFKQNKDELVQRLYNLFNSSVFDKKLPEKIDIGWNKKMLRTAGLCTTGETQHPKKERYAKIEISLKVCDSADRLRDTLIHEICHAASWLLDGVRDSHGDAWKYYAQKSNMVHPELPRVTRCHNYKINYRIHYECTQCKSRVGRYTRSLNTERFICARCRGSLVMLPLTRKDGTPIEPHVRPFAKYVQENYRAVKREVDGISHGDVMKKLGKDYGAKKQKQGP